MSIDINATKLIYKKTFVVYFLISFLIIKNDEFLNYLV